MNWWVEPRKEFAPIWELLGGTYRSFDVRCVAEKDIGSGLWKNLVMVAVAGNHDRGEMEARAEKDLEPFSSLEAIKKRQFGLLHAHLDASEIPAFVDGLKLGKVMVGTETVSLNPGFDKEPFITGSDRDHYPSCFEGESNLPSIQYMVQSLKPPEVSPDLQSSLRADRGISWHDVAPSWLNTTPFRTINAELIFPVYLHIDESKVTKEEYSLRFRSPKELAQKLAIKIQLRDQTGGLRDPGRVDPKDFLVRSTMREQVEYLVQYKYGVSVSDGDTVSVRVSTQHGDPYGDYRTIGTPPPQPTPQISIKSQSRGGLVLFIDILGTKGVWARRGAGEFMQRWEGIMDKVKSLVRGESAAQATYSPPPALHNAIKVSLSENNCRPYFFSDTIVVTTWGQDSPEVLLPALADLSATLLLEALRVGLPLRGAISMGEYYTSPSDTMVVGPALDDAEEWSKRADWVGVVLSPSAGFAWDSFRSAEGIRDVALSQSRKSSITSDDGTSITGEFWSVCWPLYVSDRRLILEALSKNLTGASSANKFFNTLAYFDEVQNTSHKSS